jgi:hypothetical protein
LAWICSHCGLTLVNITLKCYCGQQRGEFEPFDSIDEIISQSRFSKLDKILGECMTPQEELFKTLFNHEKVLVKDMDILTLRAHREELAKIAFEARARLTAVDDEEKGRKKKADGNGKPTGFSRNLNTDEATTDAINAVKDRQKRMSKNDKIIEGLIKLGYSREDAEKKMTAGTILGRLKNIKSEQATEQTTEEKKPLFNPFAK